MSLQEGPPRPPRHAGIVARRFLRHRLAVAGLAVLAGVVLLALVGGHLWRYGYTVQSNDLSQAPGWKHPFGTDALGHDMLAQVLRGANKSVMIALVVAALSTTFGTLVGALAGFYRGWVDAALMRATDLTLTVPSYAAAAVLAYQFGTRRNGWVYLALLLAAFAWMPVARVVRGVFVSLREKEYVQAARALGASNRRILLRHVLPNAMGSIIVNATLVVAAAILAETALSYIGLGIQPPDTSLGLLVSYGEGAATTRPWLFYIPGLFIVIIVLAVNFVGDGLREAFDPTQRQGQGQGGSGGRGRR